jgi:protein-S-isoprenylcysteine O-methyltransferase Ste14
VTHAALLAGLFLAPLTLLALGHRLRERTRIQRGAFWGGVIGHSIALIIAVTAMHAPPVLWDSPTRVAMAFWLMLTGAALGATAGALRAHHRRPPQ